MNVLELKPKQRAQQQTLDPIGLMFFFVLSTPKKELEHIQSNLTDPNHDIKIQII